MKELIIFQSLKYKTILSYYLKCKRNTENTNPRVLKSINGKTILSSKCTICSSRKLRFVNNQEAKYYEVVQVLKHH